MIRPAIGLATATDRPSPVMRAAPAAALARWLTDPPEGAGGRFRQGASKLVAQILEGLDPARLAADDFRRGNPRFQSDALARNQRLLDGLSAVAARRNASSGQIALAWLVDRAPGVVPIPGTRRVARLAENAAAMDLALTPGEIAELDGLFPPGAAAGARYAEGGTAGIEVL